MMRKRNAGGVGGTIGATISEARKSDFQTTTCEKEETTAVTVIFPWKMKSHLCRRQP